MDVKSYLSSVCHTSGFRFALPVKLGGHTLWKKIKTDLVSVLSQGGLVYTREVDLQLPVWDLMSYRRISLDNMTWGERDQSWLLSLQSLKMHSGLLCIPNVLLFRAEPPTWPNPALNSYSLVTHSTTRVPTHGLSQMKTKPLQVIKPNLKC